MYSRKIYKSLKQHLSKPQITVITGMRRVGKTTLTKSLLNEIKSKNKIYLDLERMDQREIFTEKNYETVINYLQQNGLNEKEKLYIAIDEIQLVPNIASVIKYLYDNYHIKFITTGSSSYYLKNLFSESLSGRKKVFDLHTLDFGEFLTFKEVSFMKQDFLKTKFNASEYNRIKNYYEEFIEYGGFPEIVLTKNIEDKKSILLDILNSYINIDVKSLSDFRNIEELRQLLKLLATRAGSKIDYSKISSLIGLSRITVKNYIDFLENTFIIRRVNVFTKNSDREITKAQKIYFEDNGMLKILGNENSGAKFENAIFNQLKQTGNIQYYCKKNGQEIDFIYNESTGLEVKETPLQQDKTNLNRLAENIDLKNNYLIGKSPSPKFEDFIWGGEIR
jgi:uncharacterized protein